MWSKPVPPNLRVKTTVGVDGMTAEYEIPERPDRCPLCHHGIDPIQIAAHAVEDNGLEVVFRCPLKPCQRLFIAHYENSYNRWYFRGEVAPQNIEPPDFPAVIPEVSRDFVQIYTEAREAHQRKRLRIAGVGYRKALEFLIKDYLIGRLPKDEEGEKQKSGIIKAQLGPCIRDYVDDPRVKAVAERATWLGNDETHYARLWEGKTIDDLTRLIDLTVHWIAMERATEEVLTEMREGKKT
jgi:hypothetical protein